MSILDRLFGREGASEKSAPGSGQASDAIERIARLSPQLRLAERYQEQHGSAARTDVQRTTVNFSALHGIRKCTVQPATVTMCRSK
jgi:hypothetical protein